MTPGLLSSVPHEAEIFLGHRKFLSRYSYHAKL